MKESINKETVKDELSEDEYTSFMESSKDLDRTEERDVSSVKNLSSSSLDF